MRFKSLLLGSIALGLSSFSSAQTVTLGQVDTFSNGETHAWAGSSAPYGPENVPSGGPLGALDSFCRVEAAGGFGPGSRLAMYNLAQWTGFYTAEGIAVVRCDMKVLAGGALVIRPVAFGQEGTRLTTTNAYAQNLSADGRWHRLNLFLTQPALVSTIGGESYADVMANVGTFLIRHQSGDPMSGGTGVVGTWGIDNITASDTAVFEPTSLLVVQGDELSGNLNSLVYSDDDRFTILSSSTLVGEIEVSATTPLHAPAAIGFQAESSAARLGLALSVSLYRFSTNSFQTVLGATATGTDSSVSVQLTTNPGNYISNTGQMRARVKWAPINDEDPAVDGWALEVDQVAFTIRP